MKISGIRFIGLYSFFVTVKGSVDSLKASNIDNLARNENVKEDFDASDSHRQLAIVYEQVNGLNCNSPSLGIDQCCVEVQGGTVNSCVQENGCIDVTTVGKGSCIGFKACVATGEAMFGHNSCRANLACASVGQGGGFAEIGNNSCGDGFDLCHSAGINSGFARIGDDSCNGYGEGGVCFSVGGVMGRGIIGKNSCNGGAAACRKLGEENSAGVTVGDSSCNRMLACSEVGYSQNPPADRKAISIGSGSCNCWHCCSCLIDGDIVPDNSCNSLGNGVDQCCASSGVRNTDFDFSNSGGAMVSDPTLPGTVLDITSSSPTKTPTIAPTKESSAEPTITLPQTGEWFISSDFGKITETSLSSDKIQISLPFNISNRLYDVDVFTKDCLTPFNNSAFDIFTNNHSSVKADGFIQFNSTLIMDINSINGTEYFKKFSDGTQGGWVEVCVQTYLWFNEDSDLNDNAGKQRVAFRNVLLNISVSLISEFSTGTGVSVEIVSSESEDIKIDYSDEIVAYECYVDDPETEVSDKTYSQGSTLTICVSTEDTTLVQVEEVFNLYVTQNDEPYNYIRNGLYNEDITTPVCLSAGSKRVCYATIVLLARFFSESVPQDLTVSGSVLLLRSDQVVNRNHQISLKAPDMNEGKEDSHGVISERRANKISGENGEFSLAVSLQPPVYRFSDVSLNYGPRTIVTKIMTVGVIGAAIMAY